VLHPGRRMDAAGAGGAAARRAVAAAGADGSRGIWSEPGMSIPPARTLTPDPSPAPSLPPAPGEGKKKQQFLAVLPALPMWWREGFIKNLLCFSPSSPGVGGREGAGEEGRGGEGRAGDRVRRWTRILSAYFSTQTVVQLTGIAAGLLFVNFMPVREFARYTLAFSTITFFNLVTDLGSSTSLVYFFHQAAKQGEDPHPYLQAVLSLRRLAFLLGTTAVLLAFPRAAGLKGYGPGEALLTTGGIVLCVWFQITQNLRVLALRLADRYGA